MITASPLPVARTCGALARAPGSPLLEGGTWYVGDAVGAGLVYELESGTLAGATHLCADLLLDGDTLAVFQVELGESSSGAACLVSFGLLNQCSARVRIPLSCVNQQRWMLEREGAWLKPLVIGDRVDLAQVDRLCFTLHRKAEGRVRWCMTPLSATAEPPPPLPEPLLPRGPLVDELGQSRLRDWPGKSRRRDEVTARLRQRLDQARQQQAPADRSSWGGDTKRRFDATGFFRTERAGGRWWLVDPDGCAFWSAGPDCVVAETDARYPGLEPALEGLPDPDGDLRDAYHPGPSFNHLAQNFIHAFGGEWRNAWARVATAELRRLGFNTIANWSDWRVAREHAVPYVRPLELELTRVARVFRDFPDVFDEAFLTAAAEFAQQLVETADDPALIGYFLMNEPTWGFADQTPAEGMLFATEGGPARRALRQQLATRYGTDAALAAAWGQDVTLDRVASGRWDTSLSEVARAELEQFSEVMVDRLFGELTRACHAADPNHLNLGARYYKAPPVWAHAGMRHFDVLSFNCYQARVDERFGEVATALDRPALIGEFHFGALDAGLPASGIGRVRTQADRGRAYRVYVEDAASQPWCVGAHYFTLYDQSAIGRFDGETYQIGFLDVCHARYDPLCEAARRTHERIYAVAAGELAPYADAPEYLPPLFC